MSSKFVKKRLTCTSFKVIKVTYSGFFPYYYSVEHTEVKEEIITRETDCLSGAVIAHTPDITIDGEKFTIKDINIQGNEVIYHCYNEFRVDTDDFREKFTLAYELNSQIENSIKDDGYKQPFLANVYEEYGTLAKIYVDKIV